MRTTLLFLCASLVACNKPPPEASAELVATTFDLFSDFEADLDEEGMTAYLNGLETLRDEVAKTDWEASTKDRAVTLEILQGDDLGDLEIPAGVDAADQVPVALADISDYTVDDQRELHVEPNQVCIQSETTKWAGREFLSDDACWLDDTCDRLDTLTEIRKENILAKVWFDQYDTYKSFLIDDGDTQVVLQRGWIEEQFEGDGGNATWDQLFALTLYAPLPGDEDKTMIWTGFWSSITLTGIGPDAYAGLVRDGLQEAYIFGDEFLDGNIESCGNDRNAEKPPRE